MKIIMLTMIIFIKIQTLTFANGERAISYASDYFNNAKLLKSHVITLTLLKDSSYEMKLMDVSHESMQHIFFISFGSYYRKGNKFYFKDTLYKFEFEANIEEDGLTFTDKFELLKGMKIKGEYQKENFKRTTIWSRIEKNMILLSNFDEIFNYDVKYKFTTGIYEVKIYNRVELSLKSDSTFIFKFLDKEIIRGNWTKTNNIINLKDTKNKMQYRITVVGNNKIFLHNMPIIGYSHYHGRPRIMKLIKNKK